MLLRLLNFQSILTVILGLHLSIEHLEYCFAFTFDEVIVMLSKNPDSY